MRLVFAASLLSVHMMTLRSKSKDWLVLNPDNILVSDLEWNNMSTHELFSLNTFNCRKHSHGMVYGNERVSQ
jgi:hypothetical protein